MKLLKERLIQSSPSKGNRYKLLKPLYLCAVLISKPNFSSSIVRPDLSKFSSTTADTLHERKIQANLVEDVLFSPSQETESESDPDFLSVTDSLIAGIDHQVEGLYHKPLYVAPSVSPSSDPTQIPSDSPSVSPSFEPSSLPTSLPTTSLVPSVFPSSMSSTEPTSIPSTGPTISLSPTVGPSAAPISPTSQPTIPLNVASLEQTNSERQGGVRHKFWLIPTLTIFFVMGGAFLCFFDFDRKRTDEFDDIHSETDEAYPPVNIDLFDDNFECVDFTEQGSAMGESVNSMNDWVVRVDENGDSFETYADTIEL